MTDQLVIDYKEAFNGEHGKRVLNDLRRKCLSFDLTAQQVNQNFDSNKEWYQEGQRSVLLHIYTMLNKDPYEEKQEKAITKRKGN